jgi:hypothetical protein
LQWRKKICENKKRNDYRTNCIKQSGKIKTEPIKKSLKHYRGTSIE